MKQNHLLRSCRLTAALALLPVLTSCAGDEEPPPPTIISLTMKADATVNPDASGQPKPIAVHVYSLASVNRFLKADFLQLRDDAEGVLGDDLLASENYVIPPGGTEAFQQQLDEDARFLAVIGDYSQIDQAKWRAYTEIPLEKMTLLTAEFRIREVELREGI